MGEAKLRYLLKRGEGGRPRETVLQERVEMEMRDFDDDSGRIEIVWVDVPLVCEENT